MKTFSDSCCINEVALANFACYVFVQRFQFDPSLHGRARCQDAAKFTIPSLKFCKIHLIFSEMFHTYYDSVTFSTFCFCGRRPSRRRRRSGSWWCFLFLPLSSRFLLFSFIRMTDKVRGTGLQLFSSCYTRTLAQWLKSWLKYMYWGRK